MPDVNQEFESIRSELENNNDSKTQGKVTKAIREVYEEAQKLDEKLFADFKEAHKDDSFIQETGDPMSLRPEDKKEFEEFKANSEEMKAKVGEAVKKVSEIQEDRQHKIEVIGGKFNKETGEYENSKIKELQEMAEKEIKNRQDEIEENKNRISALDQEIEAKQNELAAAKTEEEKASIQAEIDKLNGEKGELTAKNEKLNTEIGQINENVVGKIDSELQKPLQEAAKTHNQVREQSYNALVNTFGEKNITPEQAKKVLGETNYKAMQEKINQRIEENQKTSEEVEKKVDNNQRMNNAEQQPRQQGGQQVPGTIADGVANGFAAGIQQAAQEQVVEEQQPVSADKAIANDALEWLGYDASKPMTVGAAKKFLKNFANEEGKQMDILKDPESAQAVFDAMNKVENGNFLQKLGYGKTRKMLLQAADDFLPKKAVEEFKKNNPEVVYKTQQGNEYNELLGNYDKSLRELQERVEKEGATPELREEFDRLEKKYAPIIAVNEYRVKTSKYATKDGKNLLSSANSIKDKIEEKMSKDIDEEEIQQPTEEEIMKMDEEKILAELQGNVDRMSVEEFKNYISQVKEYGDKDMLAKISNGSIKLDDEKSKAYDETMKPKDYVDGLENRPGFEEKLQEKMDNMAQRKEDSKTIVDKAKDKFNETHDKVEDFFGGLKNDVASDAEKQSKDVEHEKNDIVEEMYTNRFAGMTPEEREEAINSMKDTEMKKKLAEIDLKKNREEKGYTREEGK